MRRWRALLAVGLTCAGAARAQTRPDATPAVALVRVERASARDATAALAVRRPALVRCVTRARAVAPDAVARLRFIVATIRLQRDGTTFSVALSPPLAARGLSSCIAEELLDWSQGGAVGPRGAVTLRISVADMSDR